jgi:uncharacterized protein YjiS (DUF1127 family)
MRRKSSGIEKCSEINSVIAPNYDRINSSVQSRMRASVKKGGPWPAAADEEGDPMSMRILERRAAGLHLSRRETRPGLRQMLEVWLRRARTRRQLAALTDRELRDLGIDRGDCLRESAKPFWEK